MIEFYTTYLTSWVGLVLFLILAFTTGYLIRKIFRWADPLHYIQMNHHDEIVIELHCDIAEFASAILFLGLMIPTMAALPNRPIALFAFVAVAVIVIVAGRVVSAGWNILVQSKRLRSMPEEFVGTEY